MVLLLALLSLPARPCAAIFVEEGGTASTDAQEAILEQRDGAVEVTWRVQVVHDTGRMGWIIPLYGPFESLDEADPARFDALHDRTDPLVWFESQDDSSGGGGLGCGAAKGSDNALGGERGDTGSLGVEIVAEGFTGSYSYVVLSGEDEDEVLQWLDAEGYDVGPSGPAIAAYVAEGGIQLLALSVVTDHDDEARRELPPVTVRYGGASLRYPSLMTLYGMPSEVSSRVFVLGEQRATVGGGWDSVELGSRQAPSGLPDADSAYAALLRELVGDDPTYVEVWSGPYDGAHLTRFDTIAVRAAHTSDARFALDGGTGSTEGELWITARQAAGAAWLLLPGLVGLGGWLRRRR